MADIKVGIYAKKDDQNKDEDSESSDEDGFEVMKLKIKENIKKSMMESFAEFELLDKSEIGSKKTFNPLMESMYPNEVHQNVRCVGCGMFPIIGVRYKCTVNKNFDFCENCEATKDHPYAFLKIKRAGTVDDKKG